MIGSEMSIYHSCVDVLVPEELLDSRKVSSGHNKMTRESMPEGMKIDVLYTKPLTETY